MTTLQGALRLVGALWLLALSTLVAVGMLRGTVTVRGLLRDKTPGGRGGSSAGRVQLLVTTLAIASLYVRSIAKRSDMVRLPVVPLAGVIVLGTSNSIYLTSKVVSAIRARARKGTSGP